MSWGMWGKEYNGVVHQLFIDFRNAYVSVQREVLCNILTEFGIPMKLVRLKKCVEMKCIVKSGYANICLIHFLLRRV